MEREIRIVTAGGRNAGLRDICLGKERNDFCKLRSDTDSMLRLGASRFRNESALMLGNEVYYIHLKLNASST